MSIVVLAVNDVPVASGKTISAVQGRPSIAEAVLATFTDPDNQAPASDEATIDWGDGSPATAGNVSGASGSFRVTDGGSRQPWQQ